MYFVLGQNIKGNQIISKSVFPCNGYNFTIDVRVVPPVSPSRKFLNSLLHLYENFCNTRLPTLN